MWLDVASPPQTYPLVILYALETFSRTILMAVIPVEALALLGHAQAVSVLFFMGGFVGLVSNFAIPPLVRRFNRRAVFSLGVLCALLAQILYLQHTALFLMAALLLHAFAVACTDITFSLYTMAAIRRQDMGRFEPIRIFFAAFAFIIGPWLGSWMRVQFTPELPFWVSAGTLILLCAPFWYFRLTDNPAVYAGPRKPPNPLSSVPRFFSQPRMRLAWMLAFGRNFWWTVLFIYGPIYAVTSGLGEVVGGLIVSLANIFLLTVPLWGQVGRRYGLRRLLIVGYILTGVTAVGAAFVAGVPWLAATLLVFTAVGGAVIDGAGNVPFLRAVRPLERAEMTAVYASWRHAGQLAAPGIFAGVLMLFELPAVFVIGGAVALAMAFVSRYVPKRM